MRSTEVTSLWRKGVETARRYKEDERAAALFHKRAAVSVANVLSNESTHFISVNFH